MAVTDRRLEHGGGQAAVLPEAPENLDALQPHHVLAMVELIARNPHTVASHRKAEILDALLMSEHLRLEALPQLQARLLDLARVAGHSPEVLKAALGLNSRQAVEWRQKNAQRRIEESGAKPAEDSGVQTRRSQKAAWIERNGPQVLDLARLVVAVHSAGDLPLEPDDEWWILDIADDLGSGVEVEDSAAIMSKLGGLYSCLDLTKAAIRHSSVVQAIAQFVREYRAIAAT